MKIRNAELNERLSSGLRLMAWSVLAGLWMLAVAPVHGQFDILLSPQVAQPELRPGSRTMVTFELTNQERELTLSVRLYAKDSYQGPRGEYKLSDTTLPYSCVDWLVLPDTLIEIAPGETRYVPVGIEVPSRAVGGAYGAVVFELLPKVERREAQDVMEARFEYRFQVPVWLEITVKRSVGARRRLMPGEITVTPTSEIPSLDKQFGDRGMRVSMEVENTGNIHVFTEGRLIIRDENRRLVRDTRLGSGRGLVLPGAKTPLRSIMPLPKPGQYTIKAFVNYGGRSPAIAQTTFEISADRRSQVGESEMALPLYLEFRPEKYDHSVPGGGFRTFAVSMINREESPVAVDVSLAELTYTRDGQMWIPEEEPDTGRSCTPWLTVDPPQFTLGANRRQNVRVTLAVPDTAAGGYYGCVVLNARSTADTSEAGLPSPLYVPVYVTVPPDIEHGGEIVDINFDQTERDVTIKTKFRNTGNIHEILRGRANIQVWVVPEKVEGVEIMDTARFENFLGIALETDSTYVLPGGERVISSQTMTGLLAGRYRAEVTIHYGGEAPAILEREFVVEETE